MKKEEKPKPKPKALPKTNKQFTVVYPDTDYEPKHFDGQEINEYIRKSKRKYRVIENKTGKFVFSKSYEG